MTKVQPADCAGERHNRKEVNAMKYTKPEVTLLLSAVEAVQSGSSDKNYPQVPDSPHTAGSNSAYEADE
jgi:hypothetical protein